MTADSVRGVRLLFLGVVSILLLASFALEDPRMNPVRNEISNGVNSSRPSAANILFNLQPGIFHPLTEEYVRRQAKELPYDFSDADIFPEPKPGRVFEQYSPLELALLSPEAFSSRKKKSRKLILTSPASEERWRPLTKEEQEVREREVALKAVEMGMELADSLSMPSVADGILWTTRRFNAYQDHLAEQYRLHFKVSGDDATVTYKVNY